MGIGCSLSLPLCVRASVNMHMYMCVYLCMHVSLCVHVRVCIYFTAYSMQTEPIHFSWCVSLSLFPFLAVLACDWNLITVLIVLPPGPLTYPGIVGIDYLCLSPALPLSLSLPPPPSIHFSLSLHVYVSVCWLELHVVCGSLTDCWGGRNTICQHLPPTGMHYQIHPVSSSTWSHD